MRHAWEAPLFSIDNQRCSSWWPTTPVVAAKTDRYTMSANLFSNFRQTNFMKPNTLTLAINLINAIPAPIIQPGPDADTWTLRFCRKAQRQGKY